MAGLTEPKAGEMNRRCTVYGVSHTPDSDVRTLKSREEIMTVWCKVEVIGGQVYWDTVGTVDSVTHRIFVRQVKGKTEPRHFARIKECQVGDVRYRVKRVTDVNGRGVFTLLECEELEVGDGVGT